MVFSAISAVIWCIFSGVVMMAAAKVSNQRAEKMQKENMELPEDYCAYGKDKKSLAMLAVGMMLSAACGHMAAEITDSGVANAVLCVCYLGVLGAAVVDWKIHIIPNFIPFALLCARIAILLYEWVSGNFVFENLISSLLGCMLCLGGLTIADKLSSGGIGKGDVKLLAAIGFTSGVYTVFSILLFALIFCSIAAIVLVFWKKATWKSQLPFGPFIYMGFLCMLLFSYI